MKRDVKLYNVLFPIWMLLIFPVTWLIVLPGNFIIDTVVLLITLKVLNVGSIKEIYMKSIFKVWIFGFLSDFLCGAILLITQFIHGEWWEEKIMEPVAMNPFASFYAVVFVLIAIVVAGLFIYYYNSRFSFKNTELPRDTIRKISLYLAIFTAPYVVLIPSKLLYGF